MWTRKRAVVVRERQCPTAARRQLTITQPLCVALISRCIAAGPDCSRRRASRQSWRISRQRSGRSGHATERWQQLERVQRQSGRAGGQRMHAAWEVERATVIGSFGLRLLLLSLHFQTWKPFQSADCLPYIHTAPAHSARGLSTVHTSSTRTFATSAQQSHCRFYDRTHQASTRTRPVASQDSTALLAARIARYHVTTRSAAGPPLL